MDHYAVAMLDHPTHLNWKKDFNVPVQQPTASRYRFARRAASAVALLGVVAVQSACTTTPPPARVLARASLLDAQGNAKGQVEIADTGALEFQIRAIGLSPGPHGVHIHMVGKCDAPDFASAGGHWNPQARRHGAQNPDGAHLGDLPNIIIGEDGTGTLAFSVQAMLDTGEHPLIDADGAALVIHAGPDDMMTDPAGNSGGRIACGIIRKD